MAGTTGYGFTYPTSTDLVRNGASAIQTLAENINDYIAGSEALGKLIDIVVDSTNTTAGTVLNTSYADPTNNNSGSFTLGKSGVCIVNVWVRFASSGAASSNFVALNLSGAITQASSDTVSGNHQNPANSYSQHFFQVVYDGTPSTLVNYKLQAKSSSGTLTINSSRIQVITIG